MTPKWLHLLLLHYKVICTRYLQLCATSVTVPRFQSISLYCQLLCRFSPFWKCSEWPQIILNAMRSNVPHIHVCSINTPEPQSATWFVQWSVIFELPRPFWNKCTEWPQNNLEQYKAKGTLSSTSTPCSLTSAGFALRPVVLDPSAPCYDCRYHRPEVNITNYIIPRLLLPITSNYIQVSCNADVWDLT